MTTMFPAASSRNERLFVGRCPCWPLVSPTHTGRRHGITGRSHRRFVESLGLRNPAAAGDLLASYRSCAFRLRDGITGNQADAQRVAQDALWTVVRMIATSLGASASSSWLDSLAANVANPDTGRWGCCNFRHHEPKTLTANVKPK